MKPNLQTLIVVAAVAVSPWHSSVMAQVASFSHGAAEGGRILTNSSRTAITESNFHVLPPGGNYPILFVTLQPGDSDLFVFEFQAECAVSGGFGDYLSLQARFNMEVGAFGFSYFQPQDNPTDLRACSASGVEGANTHTIAKSWVIRLSNNTSSPVTHNFSIWVRAVDITADNTVIAFINNWIVRYTRYN
jgi:hypothetical protein